MIRRLWPLGIGFTLWALAFVGIYALQFLGYLAAIVMLSCTLLLQISIARRQKGEALGRAGVAATAAALGATVVTFAPTFIASACI